MERDDSVSRLHAQEQLRTLQADGAVVGARSAAPLWYLVLQSLCISGFILSFGLGRWEALGFSLSAVALVLLGMLRPAITGTRADPWAYRRPLLVGLVQTGFVVVLVALGMFVLAPAGSAVLLGVAALLAFGGSLALGIRMERALARSITESA